MDNELTNAEFDKCDRSECVHDGVRVLREHDQQFGVGDVSGRHYEQPPRVAAEQMAVTEIAVLTD